MSPQFTRPEDRCRSAESPLAEDWLTACHRSEAFAEDLAGVVGDALLPAPEPRRWRLLPRRGGGPARLPALRLRGA